MKTEVISVKSHALVFHFKYVLRQITGFIDTGLLFRLLMI